MISTEHDSIKALVFDFVHRYEGDVDYDALSAEVLHHFPTSKWKSTHWSYWRYQILHGSHSQQFTKTERANLEAGKGKGPITSPKKTKGKGASVPAISDRSIIEKLFINCIEDEQRGIAMSLAKVCHHVHPSIVAMIQTCNADTEEQARLVGIFPEGIEWASWLHEGSACVFPGVRRFVGKREQKKVHKFVPKKRVIIDDNRFPRHLWTYIAMGESYSGENWKLSGLSEFELAHIFAHKPDEQGLEDLVFREVDPSSKPYGLFSCAGNVVLIPKGFAKPTDGLPAIRVAFFKRYIELYDEKSLPGLRALREEEVPGWYEELEWNEPVLPQDWEDRVERLLQYRHKRLAKLIAAAP